MKPDGTRQRITSLLLSLALLTAGWSAPATEAIHLVLDGHPLVPLRARMEVLGAQVAWDRDTRTGQRDAGRPPKRGSDFQPSDMSPVHLHASRRD
ncbi:MAG TPA: hypothetical protein VGK74_17990 [Symbiobacteriaceae bacterium]